MKNLIPLFLIAFIACNPKEDKANVDTAIPEKEALLKNEVLKYPDSAILKENLIQYYRENNSYDIALSHADKAVKKDSLNARWWDIKATLHLENEDTVNAIRSFEKAVGLMADPQYIISLGILYAQTKNKNALLLADALLMSKAPAEKESLFIKGLYYSNTNEKQKAIFFYDKCLTVSYSFMYAYREKAVALYDLGKYNESVAVLKKAVTLQNNFEEGYFFMGRSLEKLNRTQEAIESYQTALMYAPDYIEAKDALGRLGIKN